MISLVIFILILSFLVLIHEFGHFMVAKRNGILVEEFGLGIPPRVFGKKFGDTIYSINLFPFGGFVRLKGEDSNEITSQDLSDTSNFVSKTAWQRMAVISAGVIMNMLFGVIIFYLFLGLNGFKSKEIPLLFPYEFRFGNVEKSNTVIFGLDENSPLLNADFPVALGDTLVSIEGEAVNSLYDVRRLVEDKAGQEISVVIKPASPDTLTSSKESLKDDLVELKVYPFVDSEDPKNPARLGVYLGSVAQIHYDTPLQKATAGFTHSYNILSYTISTMKNIVGFSIEERTAEPLAETVSGPVGIYSIVSKILSFSRKEALINLLDLMGQISVSLAFLNILPLPALDGGRIFFIIVELVTKKRVNPNFEARVHQFGMAALLGLLVVVTIRDLGRVF
ncbi:site-2 protease family protein [Patescibacteria group bacterium]|nr:site-2 protease family protein [Patescibacteria group bacterium]